MEFSLEMIILSILCGFVGFFLGVTHTKNKGFNPNRVRELEEELERARKTQESYEGKVVRHFSETAQLVNRLTDSYRDVHSHLADGAKKLCRGESTEAILGLESDKTEHAQQEVTDLEPPRDYAPKSSPLQTGVLNESFGIKETVDQEMTESTSRK